MGLEMVLNDYRFLIFAAVVVGLTIMAYRRADRVLTRRLRARPLQTPAEWVRALSACRGEHHLGVSLEILDLIAGRLRIDPAQLRPDDRLATELNYRGVWRQLLMDGPMDDIACELVMLFKARAIEGVSLENCHTVSELLTEVCEHVPDDLGPPHCCQKCGYDRTWNTSGRCPECGAKAGLDENV